MDQTYSDTIPVLKALPEEAQRERALISTVCNDKVHTIRRYGVAGDNDYAEHLQELHCQQLSRRTGTVVLPGSLRVTITALNPRDSLPGT